MCHHTREPTVLSTVSCRPFQLNFDRFHQTCLLPGRTSRKGGACRFPAPRGGHLPLQAVGLFLLCVSLEVFATPTRRYHSRMLIHPSPRARATRQSGCLHTRRFGTLESPPPPVDRLPWGPPSPGHGPDWHLGSKVVSGVWRSLIT